MDNYYVLLVMDKMHSSQLFLMFEICYDQKDFKVIGMMVEEYDIEVIFM
jgi:hypothetical protein